MARRGSGKFDCVVMKRQAQEQISRELKGKSIDEEIEYFRVRARKGPLGRWWRSLEKRKVAV